MMKDPERKRETATAAMRLVAFVVTLGVIGAFFLPWVRLDGMSDVHSGAALPILVISPMVEYLFAVAPVQTGVLIGCPVIMVLFAINVAAAYARRRTAIPATGVVLVAVNAIIYGTGDLVDEVYFGLSTIVGLSVALLVHQLLIKLQTKLLKERKVPSVYRSLSIVTGSGHYRWKET